MLIGKGSGSHLTVWLSVVLPHAGRKFSAAVVGRPAGALRNMSTSTSWFLCADVPTAITTRVVTTTITQHVGHSVLFVLNIHIMYPQNKTCLLLIYCRRMIFPSIYPSRSPWVAERISLHTCLSNKNIIMLFYFLLLPTQNTSGLLNLNCSDL